jgi:tetratricopeptide (TPR) repeat protein
MAFGERLNPTIDAYLARVQLALRDAPLLPTEAAVQEWSSRLEDLATQNRLSEIEHLHDWLNLTFGRGRSEQPIPLDLRLHRLLGSLYRTAKRPHRAAQEFRLAIEFAPRDVFLLRELGLAYLDGEQHEAAAKIVDRIAELDEGAFAHNVECAALKARLQRERNDLEGAVTTCTRALEQNPHSYYLADVLGQTLLRLGKVEEARGAYRRAAETIDSLDERNVWTHATRITAALVLGDEDGALRHLSAIAALDPTPDKLDRIERGLEEVRSGLKMDIVDIERWRVALRGER